MGWVWAEEFGAEEFVVIILSIVNIVRLIDFEIFVDRGTDEA